MSDWERMRAVQTGANERQVSTKGAAVYDMASNRLSSWRGLASPFNVNLVSKWRAATILQPDDPTQCGAAPPAPGRPPHARRALLVRQMWSKIIS